MMMPAPTKSNYWSVSGRFVGARQCALCHAAESKDFHHNSMSRALEPMETCAILKGSINYTWKDAKYSYRITRVGDKILYKVTDGEDTLELPLQYAFGQGKAGQTYVFEIGGEFYESRVSYYETLKGLDLTVGAKNREPTDLRTAAGRRIDRDETRDCFGCHTTGARTSAAFQLTNFQAGIQCESCHGPGGAHVDSIRDGRPAPNAIRSLKGMDTEETNEMCGVCHRTWEAVMLAGLSGVNTVRFPPYRLSISKCFSLQDRRIACTACHNPHQGLVEDDKHYDAKCAACHNQTNSSISKRTCPAGKQGCTSCHMPRVEPPESHHAFADHWIRVVKSKDETPE